MYRQTDVIPIWKYFKSKKTSTGKEGDAIFPSLKSSGVSSKEDESIVETIKLVEKAKVIGTRKRKK